MKNYLIAFLCLLFVSNLEAKSTSVWKWRAGLEQTSPAGESVRIYQRFYQDKERAFALGQLTHLKAQKVEKESFKQYADAVKKSAKKIYRPKMIVERRYGDAYVFEGFWDKGNRFFRYYVWQHKEKRHTSVSTFRISYGDKLYTETEIFQRTLYLKNSNKVKTTSFEVLDLFMNKAWAQDGCNCAPGDYLCLLLCASNGGGATGGSGGINFNDFLSEITTLNTNISAFNANVNTNWGESNNNWNASNQNWNASNENWGETNRILDETRQEFASFNQMIDRNWAESNEIIDNRMGEFNQILDQRWGESNAILEDQMQQANDILKQAMKPENAFVLAAATGAGAALGATLVGFAVDGVVFGIKKLVELFKPDMNDEEKLAAFQKAIEEYEKVSSAHKQLEDVLENLPMMMKMSRALAQTRENTLFNLQDLRVERELKQHEINAAKAREGELAEATNMPNRATCLREAIQTRIGLEDDLKDMDKLITYLQNNMNLENKFCGDLQNIWRKYLDAEMSLAALRRKLALPDMQANFLTFKAKQLEEMRENNRDIASPREARRLNDQLLDIAKETRKDAKKEVKKARKSLLNLCESGMSNIMGWQYSSTDIEKHCKHLMEDAYRLGQGTDPYGRYVKGAFPNESPDKQGLLQNLLETKLNIIGRAKNFNDWDKEIDEAYERNVTNAENHSDFMAPFKADLIRVDERLHAYQMESYLDWFKQITSDLETQRVAGGEKHADMLSRLKDVCPQVEAGWMSAR
jgi:hypothetical protein